MAAGDVAGGKTVAAQRQAWLVFEDEAGQTLRPPKARTWGRRGHTPGGSGVGQGLRSRLDRRSDLLPARPTVPADLPHDHPPRPQERTTQLQRRDYIALLDAAHQQLDGPIVLIWDNLNTHISAAMRQMINARDWLTVIRLPAYAPDLNPTEAVWSHLKRSIGNLAVTGVDHLQAIIKHRLKSIRTAPTYSTGSSLTPA
ncbi:transposase [Micromonospora chalcea]|uniref:transposase n=1 Tax=Micromonospora chalcea TaxID=1874 RepID=UPI003455DAE3